MPILQTAADSFFPADVQAMAVVYDGDGRVSGRGSSLLVAAIPLRDKISFSAFLLENYKELYDKMTQDGFGDLGSDFNKAVADFKKLHPDSKIGW